MHQPGRQAPASLAGITGDVPAAERGASADVAFRSSVRVGDVWVVKPLDQLWSEDGAQEGNIKWAVGRVAEHMLEDIYQPDGECLTCMVPEFTACRVPVVILALIIVPCQSQSFPRCVAEC